MGTWTLGADNATVRNVPEPGPGADSGAPADPAVEPHQRDSLRRQVDLSRRSRSRRSGRSPTTSPSTSATRCRIERRRLEPGRDRVGSQRPAERAQRLRRVRRMGALELRPSPSVHRQRRLSAAVFAGPAASPRQCSAAGASTRSSSRSPGAPFTVNLGVDRANIGAGPAQRPDQIRDPNLPGERTHAGSLVRHGGVRAAGAVHVRQRAAQQRRSVPASPTSISRWPRRGARRRARSSSSAGKCSTC